MGCSGNYYHLWLILAQLLAVLLTTGGSITWYEPPPIQTVPTGQNPVVHKPNNTKLREGSINASLSWNFSLSSDVTFSSLSIFFNSDTIAGVRSNGIVGVQLGFEEKFGFRWISSQRATLVIFNVTSAETGGLYSCRVSADKGFGSFSWRSEVQVDVVSPAKITFISPNETKNESDTVTLICNATGKPPPNIRWTRLPDERVVTFNITGEQDKGLYTCTANNDIGNPDSRDVYITVDNFHPVETNLSTSLNGITVVVNTSFNLICSARAKPSAKYRLCRGQKSLLNTTVGQNSVIHTTKVTERISQANYSCTPFNFYGDGPTQTITVTVHYGPSGTQLTIFPSNTTVLRGSNVTLNCHTDANPVPNEYHFYFNGNYSGSSSSGSVEAIVKDDGVYSCVPVNKVGVGVNASINVTTVDAPSVQINATTSTVVEGKNITLYCNASGKPKPAIRWTEVGSSEVLSNTSPLIVVNVSRPGTPDNMIQYQCTASNGVGSPATATANVTVHYPPTVLSFTTFPRNITVLRGSTVTLNCSADALPKAHDYQFYFEDEFVGNSSSGVFNVTVSKDGVYTCVPINTVDAGHNATVIVTAVDAPSTQINATTSTVVEGNNIALYCNASGKPNPAIRWTEVGSSEVLSNTSPLIVVNVSRPGTPDNMIQYQCTASNGVGSPATATANVTVYYSPTVLSLTTFPTNTTVLSGSTVTLKCSADAFPEAHDYQFYFEDNFVGNSSSGFFNVTVSKDGVYTCVPINTVDAGQNATVTVTVVVAPSVQIYATRKEVEEGGNLTLYCNTSGKPKPVVTWTEIETSEILSNTSTLIVESVKRGVSFGNLTQYKCTADNGVESPATAVENITVYYPPIITQPRSAEQWTVNVTKSTKRTCVADASPEATIVWKNSSGILIEDGDTLTFQNATDDDTGHYTCVAANELDSVNLTLQLNVTRMLQIVSVLTTLEEDSNLESDDLENPNTKAFIAKFEREALLACGHLCTGARVLSLGGIGKGSVIVTLEVNFSTPVTRSEGLAGLINAVNNGTLGPFTVRDFKFLERFDPPTTPTTLPKETTTKSKDEAGGVPWLIIGGVAGGVVFLCAVTGVVTWGVHSRRKCKKDAKIAHDPGSEEQRLQGDDPYAQVNNGYAETGPRSVNSREKAAAVPDYAVVDKSAKKKKKKQDEEKLPEYATVDKSKKKKKNEKVDDTYAKVDMSKKTSKKKPRSGEDMLYADLGDFSGASQMPTVATSPKAQAQLPPIKRPEPYEGTQYADITQFLKGDATLPIDGKQGTELKKKDEKTDEAGGENAPKETPM